MSRQPALFDAAEYEELLEANAAAVETILARQDDQAISNLALGSLAMNRRLAMVVAFLTNLRVLPPEFEYLYEVELGKELDELL